VGTYRLPILHQEKKIHFAFFRNFCKFSAIVILDIFEICGGKNIFYGNLNFPPKNTCHFKDDYSGKKENFVKNIQSGFFILCRS
jgi:hypothetical protein